MSYTYDLKDPRWEKKRKKILIRDGYKCTACGAKGELHVHHTYYVNHLPPWMYPDDSLLTVCSKCHDEYHRIHELTIMTDHVPSTKKKHKKKRSFKNKKPKPIINNDGASKKKSRRRHNNYAWNKAIDENIQRLKKLSEE